MSKDKPHGFCETPHENCTMNYCDENGCMNRKRNLVGDPIEMSNDKQSSLEWFANSLWDAIANGEGDVLVWNKLLEQGKAMHKKEVINFTEDWYLNGPLLGVGVLVSTSVDEHYNKTFGGNK